MDRAVESMTDEASIDPAALQRLEDWGGRKLMGQMIHLFKKNSVARLEQIRTGVWEGDPSKAEQGAHSLKSSAANVGAVEVRRIATEMERKAGEGDGAAVAGLLPDMEAAYASARARLEVIEGELSE